MKKIFLYLFITGLVLIMLTGCPATLLSKFPSDVVITLGRFNSTANSTLYGAAGGTLSVPVTISDQTGRALTGNYTVVFTLSVDNDLSTTADNTVISTGTAVAAGSEQIIDITVPSTVAAAVYTLFAAVSEAGDTVINNNTASGSADIGATNQPNLVIASLETGNDMAGYFPGAAGTLIYKIQNTGYAAIASGTSFTMNFTFNLSTVDTEVGTATITLTETLYPQGFITGTADFTMPTVALLAADNGETETTFTQWAEQLTAIVDSGTVIAEMNEGDNTNTSLWIGSASEKPELNVTSVAIALGAEYAKTGNPIEYAVTIHNSGYAAASGYSVALFVDIDNDGTNNAGDVVLYTWEAPPTVPFDAAGSGHNTIILSVPAGQVYPAITDGTYWVRAEISGLTEEWDDTDNTSNNGQSESVDFVTTAYDLEMYRMSTSLTSAVDEAAGGSVPVTYTIYNSGEDALTTDFTVHFYASDDGNLTPAGDIDLLSDTVTDTIPGNGKTVISHTLTFPGGQGTGFYTIYWVLDETGVVAEFDEGNNTVTDAEECFVFFPVTDGTANINVHCIAYNPQEGRTGTNGLRAIFYWNDWVNSTVCNRGSSKDPSERFFYFSRTLTSGEQYGLAFKERACYRTGTGLPYTFRFVPDYVYNVPESALPYALGGEDTFENNDSTSTASFLSGADNPLTGFVNAFAFTEDWSTYDEDFYLFDMP